MKDCISNNITIKEKTLVFSNDSYSNIFLFNDNQCFNIELNKGTLNLQNFVDANELILPSESTFKVGIKSEEELTQIEGAKHTYTICSDLRISSTKHTYLINIYADELKSLFLDIKRVYSGDEEVNLFDIYVHDNTLNISVESLKQGSVSEAGIVLFSSDCNIIPFICSEASNNKAHFKIDLSKLLINDVKTFKGNLVFNNNIFPICINKDIFFKEYITSENGIIYSLFISSVNELLNIEVHNDIRFEPTLTSFVIEKDLVIIKGDFNSNLTVNNLDLFELEFKLFNKEYSLDYDIKYNDTNFEISFSKDDLFTLKNVFSKKIRLRVRLTAKKDSLEKISKNNTISKDVYSNISSHLNTSSDHGFERIQTEDSLTNNFIAHLKDSSDSYVDFLIETSFDKSTKLIIGNAIKISEIPYIRARKNSVQIKFRSAINLPKDTFNLEMSSSSKKLKASKIKVIGKKTFVATFKHSSETSLKGAEVFTLLDELITKGMNLQITVGGRIYSQTISDINELTVFKNTSEFISNTRKYKKICSLAYKKLFLKLPINKKRVLFESFLGRNISGNPKYIYQQLVDSGLDEEFELIWILNDTSEQIEGKHKVVKRKSLKYYYLMATSGYWVFNSRQANGIRKREGVTYVQTWHGTPLKRLAGDMDSVNMGKTTSIKKYKNSFFKDSAKWDYLLSQNDFSKETLARAFRFDKEIIEGYPANDILYTKNNSEDINTLKEKLGLPLDKKVILYAPTWRDNQFFQAGHYKFNLQLELDKMQEKLGDEYVVALRTHYLIANAINVDEYNGFVYDFSKGFDIQELYLISDILITDYSSVMFDFANLKRPMIFFTYDLEDYRDNLRGFYFDFEETAPGPIALTTNEVIDAILNKNLAEDYKDKYENFYNTFCHIDNGNSAKNAVDIIFNLKK